MKNFCVICAALALVAGFASTLSAADAIPADTLASMGFANASVMSDDAGLAVRGKGTSASVWGSSNAYYEDKNGSAYAENGYAASARHHKGSSTAAGGSLSFAGKKSEYGRHSSSKFYVSGGGAIAYAK